MSFSKLRVSCKFCSSRSALYTCPRCNAKYCSMDCFKTSAHERCSEQFFQEWVITSLRDMPDSNDRTKMIEILKRVAQDDSEDENSSIDARFSDLNLEDDVDETLIWERLTEDEKEKFKTLLQNEKDLSEILPDVQPWWFSRKIKLVKSDTDSEMDHPPLPAGVKSLSYLTSRTPSDYVRYNVINLLYAYVFLFRLYHGDLREFHEECVDSIFQLCPVLSENKNYLTLEESVQDSIRLITKTYSDIPMSAIKSLCNDIVSIIKGPENANSHSYMFCALNDMKLLILELIKLMKSSDNKPLKSNKKLLMLAAKKIDFMLSWVLDFFEMSLQPLIKNLQLMFLPEVVEAECSVADTSSPSDAKNMKKTKMLIEELN